jgi:N-acetylglucosaminyl-diphospho-decaprenol L-rhamnosyltransferase
VISAVIVHFKGQPYLARCVRSCFDSPAIGEVLVVDNEDVAKRLRETLPREVRVVEMARNAGYGRAANVGLELSRGSAVLVLNQDAELTPGAAGAMAEAGARSGAWIVGPGLVDGRRREAAPKRGFPAPLPWPGGDGEGPGWRERPWVPGAAMLFTEGHTDLRFDERLFMYAEDEELCWRVWASGGRVVEAQDAVVIHHGGTAAGGRWSRNGVAIRTVLNRARFVRWHHGWLGAAGYLAATAGRGLLGRALRKPQ